MEDEMTLDGAIAASCFDDALETVSPFTFLLFTSYAVKEVLQHFRSQALFPGPP